MSDLPSVLLICCCGFFGAFIGSFLNVVVHRLPRNESIVHPGSRCYACGTPVAWYDNIPVLGWCWLRGSCRWCGTSFSWRYPVCEGVFAVLFAGLAAWVVHAQAYHGMFWLQLLVSEQWLVLLTVSAAGIMLCLSWAASLIDADHQIIPDQLVMPWQVVAPFLALLVPPLALNSDPAQPLLWLSDFQFGGNSVVANPWYGLLQLLPLFGGLAIVWVACLLVSRWVYGKRLLEGQQWSSEDHRAYRWGFIWFGLAVILHVLFILIVTGVASEYAGDQLVTLTLLVWQWASALIAMLIAWLIPSIIGLLGTAVFAAKCYGIW